MCPLARWLGLALAASLAIAVVAVTTRAYADEPAARADAAMRVRWAGVVALDARVPAEVVSQVDEELRDALAAEAGVSVDAATPAHGPGAPAASAEARALLARGRGDYAELRLGAAARAFEQAAAAIEAAALPPGDVDTWVAARLEAADARLGAGEVAAARGHCRALALARPALVLDRVTVPPALRALCTRERAALPPPVTLRIEAAAPVTAYVDGVAVGAETRVTPGRHFVIVTTPRTAPERAAVDVAAGQPRAPAPATVYRATLRATDARPRDRADELETALRAALAQRRPLAATTELARALLRERGAGLVVAAGVEPHGDGWRVVAAALGSDAAAPRHALAVVDRALGAAPASAARLVAALFAGDGDASRARVGGVDAGLDFTRAWLGAPPPSLTAPALALAPAAGDGNGAARADAAATRAAAKRRRRWIWGVAVGGAVLVAGALALGLTLGLGNGDGYRVHGPLP